MSIFDLIKDFDLNSIAPILELFGVDKNVVETINSDSFKNALSGNVTLKELLPLLLPLLKTFLEKRMNQNYQNHGEDYKESYVKKENLDSEYLSPIKDIASDTVVNAFERYFT